MFDNRRRALRLNAPMLRAIVPAAARNAAFLEAFRSAIVRAVLGRLAEKAAELDAAFDVPDADATRDARVRALFALFVGGLPELDGPRRPSPTRRSSMPHSG